MSIHILSGLNISSGSGLVVESGSQGQAVNATAGIRLQTVSGGAGSQTLNIGDLSGSGNKFIRINSINNPSGNLEIINKAFTSPLFVLSDIGNLSLRNDSTGTGSFILPRMPGVPTDTQFGFATDGQIVSDSSNNKVWTRINGIWQNTSPLTQPDTYVIFSGSITGSTGPYYALSNSTNLAYNGNDAATIIQAVITALGGTGGRIHIKKGTYTLLRPIIINVSSGSIHVSGEGDGTQLNLSNLSDGIIISGTAAFGANGPFQTTISDLTLSSVLPTRGRRGISILNTFGVIIRGVRGFYMSGSGIRIEDSAGLFLSDLYMEGMTGNGFTFYGSRNILANRLFSDTNNLGFEFANSQVGNGNTKNTFNNCYATINSKGYSIFGTNDTQFNNCIADGSNNDGFQVSDVNRLDFNSCSSIGNGSNGISILPTVNNMTDSGISIIGGEFIDNKTGSGISLFAQTGLPMSKFTIMGAKCFNNGINVSGSYDGIRLSTDGTSGAIINSGSIIGCITLNRSGSAPTQRYGINVALGTQYIHIDNCTVLPNSGSGIIIDTTSTGSTIKNCLGYNPVGYITPDITWTGSPFTHTNKDFVPEDVFVYSGSITSIIGSGGLSILTGSYHLEPFQSVIITTGSSAILPVIKRIGY